MNEENYKLKEPWITILAIVSVIIGVWILTGITNCK